MGLDFDEQKLGEELNYMHQFDENENVGTLWDDGSTFMLSLSCGLELLLDANSFFLFFSPSEIDANSFVIMLRVVFPSLIYICVYLRESLVIESLVIEIVIVWFGLI